MLFSPRPRLCALVPIAALALATLPFCAWPAHAAQAVINDFKVELKSNEDTPQSGLWWHELSWDYNLTWSTPSLTGGHAIDYNTDQPYIADSAVWTNTMANYYTSSPGGVTGRTSMPEYFRRYKLTVYVTTNPLTQASSIVEGDTIPDY